MSFVLVATMVHPHRRGAWREEKKLKYDFESIERTSEPVKGGDIYRPVTGDGQWTGLYADGGSKTLFCHLRVIHLVIFYLPPPCPPPVRFFGNCRAMTTADDFRRRLTAVGGVGLGIGDFRSHFLRAALLRTRRGIHPFLFDVRLDVFPIFQAARRQRARRGSPFRRRAGCTVDAEIARSRQSWTCWRWSVDSSGAFLRVDRGRYRWSSGVDHR